MDSLLGNIGNLVPLLALIAAVVYGALHFLFEYKGYKSKYTRESEHLASFKEVVKNLSSDNKSAQLSAAILLRRFFEEKFVKKNPIYRSETINVISSLLRTLPTGTLQKTLGDGLAYTDDLKNADLQRTNMQDLYIGNKKVRIDMGGTDMYLADLSHALLQNISGQNAIFYHAILLGTHIKDSDLTNANFCEADLKNINFRNVILTGADFTNAIDVPEDLLSHLTDGKYLGDEPFSSQKSASNKKTIFFSMPGRMTKNDDLLTREYQRCLTELGYKVEFYLPDDYPHAGQLNRVRHKIQESSAMVAFGFKQINIQNAIYRPGTASEENWKNRWLSTPWSEIEVGMGLMCGIPILLVKDDDVREGVFDDKLSECFVDSISTDVRSIHISRHPSFEDWLSRF